ncbi:hypothetical protein CLOM_g20719 [Closterium sp. NIES-68]|nr:hypothetical protein CLOM_g20719 [Closterium sp. NIES-68]
MKDEQFQALQEKLAEADAQLLAVTARCDEWKRKAQEKAREAVQLGNKVEALEERLAELDEEDVPALQMEVARLREELARSEALRFDLHRQFQAPDMSPTASRHPSVV